MSVFVCPSFTRIHTLIQPQTHTQGPFISIGRTGSPLEDRAGANWTLQTLGEELQHTHTHTYIKQSQGDSRFICRSSFMLVLLANIQIGSKRTHETRREGKKTTSSCSLRSASGNVSYRSLCLFLASSPSFPIRKMENGKRSRSEMKIITRYSWLVLLAHSAPPGRWLLVLFWRRCLESKSAVCPV